MTLYSIVSSSVSIMSSDEESGIEIGDPGGVLSGVGDHCFHSVL